MEFLIAILSGIISNLICGRGIDRIIGKNEKLEKKIIGIYNEALKQWSPYHRIPYREKAELQNIAKNFEKVLKYEIRFEDLKDKEKDFYNIFKNLALKDNLIRDYLNNLNQEHQNKILHNIQKLLLDALGSNLQEKNNSTTDVEVRSNRTINPPKVGLIGRNSIIREIRKSLQGADPNIIIITGERGIGKSSVAKKIASEFTNGYKWSKDYDHLIWTTAQSKILQPDDILDRPSFTYETTFVEIIREIATYFGQPQIVYTEKEEQVRLILELFRRNRAILIIDNFESLLNNNEFLFKYMDKHLVHLLLEFSGNSKLILTSSIKPSISINYSQYVITELERDDTLKLLEKLRKTSALELDPESDIELYNNLGGKPLALEWVIGQNDGLDLKSSLKKAKSTKANLFKYIFETNWYSLNNEERILLILLSLLPESLSFSSMKEILDAEFDLVQILVSLKRKFLIENTFTTINENTRFSIHSLARIYIIELMQELPDMVNSCRKGMYKWAKETTQLNSSWSINSRVYNSISPDISNLLSILIFEINNDSKVNDFIDFAEQILYIIHIQGRWNEFEVLTLQIIERFGDTNTFNLQVLLGRHYAHQRKICEAKSILDKVLKQISKEHNPEIYSEALLRYGQALSHEDSAEALTHLREVIEFSKKNDLSNIEISVIGYMADLMFQDGQYNNAIRLLTSQLRSSRNTWERANAYYYCIIGDCYKHLGRNKYALNYYNLALTLSIRWKDARLKGWALLGIGENGDKSLIQEAMHIFKTCKMDRELKRATSSFSRILHLEKIKIFVIGAPASGKSTICDFVMKWFLDKKMSIEHLSLDKIHQLKSKETAEEEYKFGEHGELILLNPEEQIPEAIDELKRKIICRSQNKSLLVEFTNKDLDNFFKTIPKKNIKNSLVLIVKSPINIRLTRNENRESRKVPYSIVKQYAEDINNETYHNLYKNGVLVTEIRTNNKLEKLKGRINIFLNDFIN